MHSENRIFIIGSGAIGKALAVFLKLAGREVVLVRGSVDKESSRTERIRVETANDIIHQAELEIATLSAFDEMNGIIVLTNKSYGNEHLSSVLKTKKGSSPVVLLQNGLGVEQAFIANDFTEVYRCVLFVTSQSIDDRSVRFKPVAFSPVGIEKGTSATLNTIVKHLHTADFPFSSEENIQHTIWKKAIINCVFNSVCPLLETENGIFHRNETALSLAKRLIAECTTIAACKGISISADEVEETLQQISKSSEGQLISTLQDIRNHRRTEIDTLNLEIVKIAHSLGKEHEVQSTQLLGELTKLKADLNITDHK
ncbi:ketopantoate reductase family protein [Desertivirga xinjiangensis]|uniref:ketopantoate reductase family protein n=1 Tax=Desertivirga xinjiangensis TaxID=539206 RepID=UPI0021094562|nr:2-dehydropantoate 2-reductase [Pedobacter xinjiangensis]